MRSHSSASCCLVYKSRVFPTMFSVAIIAVVLLSPQLSDPQRVSAASYVIPPPINTHQKDSNSIQGLTGSINPFVCNSPLKRSILKINTIIQDTNHFVKVPLSSLVFGISVQNGGIVKPFRIGLTNPLTICMNPG